MNPLYPHPVPGWPFPQWLPYPYKQPRIPRVAPTTPAGDPAPM